MISIVLVTFNRLHLLRQCVDNVLARTSDLTREIIIWNNASGTETRDYLDSLVDPRVRVIHHPTNIGTNAYARAFREARGEYLLELDDDVIDAPMHWDRSMLDAYRALPRMGFLAANVLDDGRSVAAEIMYRRDGHLYERRVEHGVELLIGPTGGWCTMTSRAVYEQVGGFATDNRFVYWHEDAAYVNRVRRHGFDAAILASLKVLHASGPAYSSDPTRTAEKERYDNWRIARARRRNAIKRILDRIPPVRALNRRFGFYRLPDRDPV